MVKLLSLTSSSLLIVINKGDYIDMGIQLKSKKVDGWATLLAESTTQQEFMTAASAAFPRDYVLNLEKLEYFAKQKYQKIQTYTIEYPNFVNVPTVLTDWVRNSLGSGDRPKSLFLCGASRLGKTEWARSLGAHTYFGHMFNLDDWNYAGGYLVIDDIAWQYVPSKKALFGAQKTFTLTDKYRKKQTIDWGKPCIYLCNDDMDEYATCTERYWLKENCVYYKLTNKLY
jgi:hypothetical protein